MNVLNVHEVERELNKASAQALHPTARKWVVTVARNHVLGRLSEKDIDTNFRAYNPDKLDPVMPRPEQLPDWARQALERGEVLHWFDRVQPRRRTLWQTLNMIVLWFNTFKPEDTRLRRLDRISFDVAAKAGAFWFKDISDNVWLYVKDKPPTIQTYDHGFFWVKLVTALHFEREGRLQKHCISNGGYFETWRNGHNQYFSLRDKHNNPHVTVEVRFTDSLGHKSHKGTLMQCKGSCNARPDSRYQPYIRQFILDQKWTVGGDTHHIDMTGLPRADGT